MIEMQVLSARDNRSPVPDGVRDSIFAHYGTDPEDFRATLRSYSRRPSEFRSLFSSTIDSLNAIEQRHRRETISSEDPQSPPR